MKSTINIHQQGYDYQNGVYTCLYCEQSFEEGYIYSLNGRNATAKKAMEEHINSEHDGALYALISQSKKISGLSETQQEILELFAQQLSDSVIAQRLGITTSAVRNHRFKLREKERQATVFLSIMNLLKDESYVLPHKGARMIDERYQITQEEKQQVLSTFFSEDQKLISLPRKEKRKVIVLAKIAESFDSKKNYSEKAVNQVIQLFFEDFVTVRRYLIEYGFLNRTKDGQSYWRID
ncbi:LytTR family transcriptional regulator [Enterococcus florum]|uniref:LytTR family transcriptional regulator n=1 Tax=Enterococcus florum TaxID=2480627 RepID=A0A4P5PGL2_9ENTE|nr:DUF2087 domain-containing protein [Enterococcus florum]GCF95914.1 LytTR family transcriptional regulator [Enterococcus florum]